jgi:2,4-dienoyl-CoA reductase-like NADH-dependent reductase (Old Yellow Enzyme family)/thioredoxin reductase
MNTFDSLALGPLKLGNRLLMAPVKTAFGGTDGKVTSRLIDYYRRRARGGVGAIIVEPMFVVAAGKEHPKQLTVANDDAIDGLRRLIDAIHDEGAKAIGHINHAGRAANPKASKREPEAPSAVPCPSTGASPQVMTSQRIEGVIAEFGEAARRARSAGFDGVEVQCGLGYLAAQFLSEKTNQRDDEWGGTPENRLRFVERVIATVRQAVGESVAVTARISGAEQVDGGLGIEDAVRLGKRLVELGVDAIHVASGSACDSPPWYYQHMSLPAGVNVKLAEDLRRHLDVPVVVAGRLGDPGEIARLFSEGRVDGIALGRSLVADPDLPNKMRGGQEDLVVQCGGCLQGCLTGVKSGRGIGCIVNPEVGREGTKVAVPSGQKHVVVVGGGPAGLVAARVAAERGHRVTLLERSAAQLGGQFAQAHRAPGKEAMRHTLDSLVRRTKASGVEIRMGTEATVAGLVGLRPDVVLVATGAEPILLAIPGLAGALTGEQVLADEAHVGRRVLVIGGGLVGIEAADYLAERDHEVVVVEMLAELARDMEPITRKLTLKRLQNRAVVLLTDTKVTRIAEGRAIAEGPDGKRDLGAFDSVVLAVGTRPVDLLSQALRSQGIEVRVLGDAARIDQVQGATTSGWVSAVEL